MYPTDLTGIFVESANVIIGGTNTKRPMIVPYPHRLKRTTVQARGAMPVNQGSGISDSRTEYIVGCRTTASNRAYCRCEVSGTDEDNLVAKLRSRHVNTMMCGHILVLPGRPMGPRTAGVISYNTAWLSPRLFQQAHHGRRTGI